MDTIRLTMAQALVGYLAAQRTEVAGVEMPLFAGIWAIFGHGNVAGLGEALAAAGETLTTFRSHNEQAMAHSAIAFAKASARRRIMACTTSIGPGATNMVTAAALAHVNRLPVLLLPADVFASRRPDPVLQQLEDFEDGTVSVNDCFRPVSRYFDRILRPEQILAALPRAMSVLTDPAECGPVTLSLCQDVQAEAFDCPRAFLTPRVWRIRRPPPDPAELADAAAALRTAKAPLAIAGGGVAYSGAAAALDHFCRTHAIPFAETQAGKGTLTSAHPLNLGAIGVTGTAAANALAREADVVLAVGTRLTDFTTGSHVLFRPERRLIGLNVQPFDAAKQFAFPLIADARAGLAALDDALGDYRAPAGWEARAKDGIAAWQETLLRVSAPSNRPRPSDAEVIGVVRRVAGPEGVIVAAAGGLPGELHKLWQSHLPGDYHLEYGYSCMGYEIAGALGVALARPEAAVFTLLGDGSYLMMNSEIATSVMLGLKLILVVLDNGGFGCIDRLQRATGGASFNNLLADARHVTLPPIDFAAHAASLGAISERVRTIAELEAALVRARAAPRTFVAVIETDPAITTQEGGAWWEVGVPEVSTRAEVRAARAAYEQHLTARA
ncbi:MAG TPA: 3D-(3,5/4)-trihydroxycyclohexane-1,2-dione acylhydrolase (decyclizing) [Acetobacteraceae bacterium]|nr:3D-(3,5/4)-trihydroxycyclohexane-1,2-dione acylhydrolase (decyclizing) [Acetobacteraceae bacterium]